MNTLSSEGSKRIYKRHWRYFKEFTGMSTEQILEAKKKEENGVWKSKLFAFKKWLMEERGLAPNTAKTATGVVRGFFGYYEIPIRIRRSESKRLDKAARTTRDYKFTRKDIAKMSLVADLEENYILLFGKSVGLRASDFIKFTYGDFRAIDLDSEVPIFLGEFNTKKEGVPAYCFIDSDALPIVKAVLENGINKKGKDRIITIRSSELSVILRRIAEKAKVQHGNARIRFHCLRKWLITRLSASTSESQWKQIVGKAIDEDAYVSTELLRTVYKNALKDLTVLSGNGNGQSAKVELLEEAINALDSENKEFKIKVGLLERVSKDRESKIKELNNYNNELREKLHNEIRDVNHELGRTSSLLEIMIENVLTTEQREKLKKISKKHFGDVYPL